MKELVVTSTAAIIALFNVAQAVDGYMFPNGNRNWDYSENWKDGIIASGEDATAYLYYNNPNCEIKLNGDVVLHALKVSGVRLESAPIIRTSSAPSAAFLMKNNPVIHYMPAYHENSVVMTRGSEMYKGDGSVLTFEGGALGFENNSAAKYMMSGFSQVFMKSHPNVWMQGTGCGLASGDVKFENTNLRFVWTASTATTANNFVGGTLTIGQGLSDVQWDNGRTCTLANRLERERTGMFRINPNGTAGTQCVIPNADELMGTKGRLPTWFLKTGDAFNFLTYDNGQITDANSLMTKQLDSSSKDDAVIYSGAGLPSSATLTAAAVHAKTTLNLNGKTLALGNESEPGLLVMNANVDAGDISFAGEEGLLVCAGNTKERHLSSKLTGTNSLSVFGGYKEVANLLYLDNASNDLSGGIDLMTGNLSVTNAGALGTGAVRVHGYPASYDFGINGSRIVCFGGSLGLDGCTITNDLSLAGMGCVNFYENVIDHAVRSTASALYLMKNSGVEGNVILTDTAAIRSAKDSGEIVVSGSVTDVSATNDSTGDFDLYLWPGVNSELKLLNEITTGGIVVTAPTNALGVRAIGTVVFDTGTVVNTKTLRNECTLKCEGTPVVNGCLDGSGTLIVDDGAVLSLNGSEHRIGAIFGSGSICTDVSSTIMIGADEAGDDAVFAGTIETTNDAVVTLVKEGANTQTVSVNVLANGGVIVVNDGTLKFDATGDVSNPNADVTVNEGGVLDLAGVDACVKTLSNFGTIRNSSETPVVLIVSDALLVGNVEGAVTIRVDGGKATLKNWRNIHELSVTDGMTIHLDGADVSTLQMNSAGEVTKWADKSGCGNDFVENRSGELCPPPTYDSATNSNRGSVVFDAPRSKSQEAYRLSMSGKTCVVKSVFFVTSVDSAFNTIEEGGVDSILGVGGLFGKLGYDRGIRLGGSYGGKTWWPTDIFDNGSGGRIFVNGIEKNVVIPGENVILEVDVKPTVTDEAFTWSLGQYIALNVSGNRGYKGTVSEVIAYDRFVTDAERMEITEYLRTKWMSENVMQGMTAGGNLSFAFANGGSLDLGGTVQTIGSLGGIFSGSAGAVENGSLTVSESLVVNADENGNVVPYNLNNVTLASGLKIVLDGKPSGSRIVIATGVENAEVSTFVPPSPAWKISLRNGKLSMSAIGMMIIIR